MSTVKFCGFKPMIFRRKSYTCEVSNLLKIPVSLTFSLHFNISYGPEIAKWTNKDSLNPLKTNWKSWYSVFDTFNIAIPMCFVIVIFHEMVCSMLQCHYTFSIPFTNFFFEAFNSEPSWDEIAENFIYMCNH